MIENKKKNDKKELLFQKQDPIKNNLDNITKDKDIEKNNQTPIKNNIGDDNNLNNKEDNSPDNEEDFKRKLCESIFKQFETNSYGEYQLTGKILGKGGFGEVREVKNKKGKILAVKLMEPRSDNKNKREVTLSSDIKNPYVIKTINIAKEEYNNTSYYLIIMEKAVLRDLGTLNDYYHKKNSMKLIFTPFFPKTGENLIRFYAIQIVYAITVLEMNDYVHFDIKPENILLTNLIGVKLSDFTFLRSLKNEEEMGGEYFQIPGGTPGYNTPEFYNNKRKTKSEIKTQDYFSFGSTLFNLRFGKRMLSYQNYPERDHSVDRIVDLIDKQINYIQSKKFLDKNFKNLLIRLIKPVPEERPDFEKIYRNKWLNENSIEIEKIRDVFAEEDKMIQEYQKSDFIIPKSKNTINKRKKFGLIKQKKLYKNKRKKNDEK